MIDAEYERRCPLREIFQSRHDLLTGSRVVLLSAPVPAGHSDRVDEDHDQWYAVLRHHSGVGLGRELDQPVDGLGLRQFWAVPCPHKRHLGIVVLVLD